MVDFDARLGPRTLPDEVAAFAREAESYGARTVWSSDTAAEPFMLLTLLATATTHCEVGTAITSAFGRSPYATAQAAWTAQRLSQGRAVIGLGPQVRAHVERRFGMPWHGAVRQMREYVGCCRAIFTTWQTGTLHPFEGEYYRFTLTNPEFTPAPLETAAPLVPIWLAAVGPGMARLAGEVAEGVHVHAFHTPGYLRDRFLPLVREGAAAAGRTDTMRSSSPVLAGVAHDEREAAELREYFRSVVAFYASTPAYRGVLEHMNASALHEPLRVLAREGRWHDTPALVPDDVLDELVTVGSATEVGARLRDRYTGLLTQVGIYRGGERFMGPDDWNAFLTALLA